jgi:phenylpropionate dioxygenase-like ring-hydroxylating dioxygenase large terminal subunit
MGCLYTVRVSSPAPFTATGEMLTGFWYRALRSAEVRPRKLVATTLLELPLVLGRTDSGQPFAMRDNCPHRGIPLSYGWFDGANVQCSYHGWKFEACSAQCVEIPSLTAADKLDPRFATLTKIRAGHFPCEERDGYLWVFVPDPGTSGEPTEPAPALPTFSEDYRRTHLWAELPSNVDHGIIGLMDPAHGPFVHAAWWWRGRESIHEKEKHFEPIPLGFRMSAHQPSKNSAPYQLLKWYAGDAAVTTTIDFVLPNLRYETIRAGKYWFASLTTVTPITRDRCRIDVAAAWNIFMHVPLAMTVARLFGKKFVEQDRLTMVQQAEGLKNNPSLMLIDDADKPAKWYFQLKAAHLEAKRTGAAFRHPLSGPVTLHWRS